MISTSLPDLELQPGPLNSFISVKLPCTNIDHADILVHRRVAIKQGGTLTLGGPYLWDLALLLDGLAAENEAPVNWQNQSDVVVSLIRIVTVTNSPAEAAVDFSMIPGNPVRPRVSEVPTGTSESTTCDVMLQDAELSGQNLEWQWERFI